MTQSPLSQIFHETPVGELRLVATATHLVALLWPGENRVSIPDAVTTSVSEHPLLGEVAKQLDQYFASDRTEFDLPLDPSGTKFQREAWMALRAIPYGETRTYSQQAATIGRPKAVRAIGSANGRNPISIIVPCHRVIGADGSLTGFGGGLSVKDFLLRLERSGKGQPRETSTLRPNTGAPMPQALF